MTVEKLLQSVYAITKEGFNYCWLSNIKRYMSRVLKLEDFQWIIINTEREDGYYSLKQGEWEIAIDWSLTKGWTIYLCNKFEEVLEEYGCNCQADALKIANKIYKSF